MPQSLFDNEKILHSPILNKSRTLAAVFMTAILFSLKNVSFADGSVWKYGGGQSYGFSITNYKYYLPQNSSCALFYGRFLWPQAFCSSFPVWTPHLPVLFLPPVQINGSIAVLALSISLYPVRISYLLHKVFCLYLSISQLVQERKCTPHHAEKAHAHTCYTGHQTSQFYLDGIWWNIHDPITAA